jgi:hypothetical protein
MRTLALSLLFLCLTQSSFSQFTQKPDWVKQFQSGKVRVDIVNYYHGVGSSERSQDEADAKARQEFGLNVETRVQSVITREVQETEKKLTDEYSSSARVVSDVVLRGLFVTERYEDKEERKYYSLIEIEKALYDTLLVSEIRRELVRKKEENRVMEEKRQEEIRSQQADLDLKKKKEETIRKELELEKELYADFHKLKSPEQTIDLINGEIARKAHTVAVRLGLSPVEIQSAYYRLALWKFEASIDAYLLDKKLDHEQAAFKIQLLDNAGELYRTSMAFGVVAYSNVSELAALDSVKPSISLFLGGNVGLPNAMFSHASFYLDRRKMALGLNNYPFPRHFGDAVSLLFQIDYVWDKNWRDRFNDPLLFQAGIRFRASDSFSTNFAYQNHEFFVFSIEMGF